MAMRSMRIAWKFHENVMKKRRIAPKFLTKYYKIFSKNFRKRHNHPDGTCLNLVQRTIICDKWWQKFHTSHIEINKITQMFHKMWSTRQKAPASRQNGILNLFKNSLKRHIHFVITFPQSCLKTPQKVKKYIKKIEPTTHWNKHN